MLGNCECGNVRRLNCRYQSGGWIKQPTVRTSTTIQKEIVTPSLDTTTYVAMIQLVPDDRHTVHSGAKFIYDIRWYQDENQRMAGVWLPEWEYMVVEFTDFQQGLTMTRTVGRGEFNPIDDGVYSQMFVFTDYEFGVETVGETRYKEMIANGDYLPMPTQAVFRYSCDTTPEEKYSGNQNTATAFIVEKLIYR